MYKNENILFNRAIQGNINFSTQELASVNSNTNQSLISSIINEPSHSTNFLLVFRSSIINPCYKFNAKNSSCKG